MSSDNPANSPAPPGPDQSGPSALNPAEAGSAVAPQPRGSSDLTIHLSWSQASALVPSMGSATAGRLEASRLASLGRGGHGPDDVAWLRALHAGEQAVEGVISHQIWLQREGRGTGHVPGETPVLIGMIEWPSDAVMYPDLLFGAHSLEALDRMFVARLQQVIGTPRRALRDSGDELERFVVENGWPPPSASNRQILAWLIDMRSELISTCCSIWLMPAGLGLAEVLSPDRYEEMAEGEHLP